MDTFHLTRETERDRLKCIYTAWIEAWTVDWTRVRAVHLNHHLMMMVIWCLMWLSAKKIFKSYRDDGQSIHCLQKQFSHFSLGISKSHNQMYLKWMNQNLISFANSLALSLWNALSFYPHANIHVICLLFSYKLFALTLVERMISHQQ